MNIDLDMQDLHEIRVALQFTLQQMRKIHAPTEKMEHAVHTLALAEIAQIRNYASLN